jgi:hypothetical protein
LHAAEGLSIGDYAMLWIVLFVATVVMLTLVFIPELSMEES